MNTLFNKKLRGEYKPEEIILKKQLFPVQSLNSLKMSASRRLKINDLTSLFFNECF